MVLISFEGFAILTIYAIDDYYDQGKTYEAILKVRTSLDGYTSEIDTLIAQIYDTNKLSIGNRSLSKNSRRKLANTLLKIRSYSAISSSQSSNELNTAIFKYAQVEKELTAELYTKLLHEKCIICYGSLASEHNIKLLACPHCGQGGHKNHVEQWLAKDIKQCPVCKTEVPNEGFLLLDINPD